VLIQHTFGFNGKPKLGLTGLPKSRTNIKVTLKFIPHNAKIAKISKPTYPARVQ